MFQHPNGRVIDQGQPLKREYRVNTASGCKPGRIVKRDTNDGDIQAAGEGDTSLTGVLGYLGTSLNYRPDTTDTEYNSGDMAAVHFGKRFTYVGTLVSGENVTADSYLTVAADGKLKAASTLAVKSGGTTVNSTAADGEIITGSVGQEVVVARAMESVDASGGDKAILVESYL